MFELSDEEDNFWDDIPLGDITNTTAQTSRDVEQSVPNGLRVPIPTEVAGIPVKRHCNVSDRDFPSAMEMLAAGEKISSKQAVTHGSISERPTPLVSMPSVDPDQREQTPVIPAAIRERFTTPVGASTKATPGSTPRRPRRKFPGPAGLLPKLQPGQSMESVSVPGVTPSDPDKSNKEDSVIMSSQSSDDVFLDTPWQTLLQDLETEGAQLMKTFSIATIPLKASKKQFVKGKVAMVFAVIETLDTQGSDASVTLRDKSGRIQGTVHRDLLKEYEAELQPSTVVVLRQVSVISLTNKNHYLNITPSNIVVMYQNKNDQLQKVKFHGSQDSLRSVLLSLERKSLNSNVDRNSAHGTPSSLNSSRLSYGNSSTNTPVLFGNRLNQSTPGGQGISGVNLTPNTAGGSGVGFTPRASGVRDLRFTPRTPGVRDVNFTPRAPGVRDVSFAPRVPCVRDVRFTPSSVRTPSAGVKQTEYQQRVMPVNDVNSNSLTPSSSSRIDSHALNEATSVPKSDNFRAGSVSRLQNTSVSNRSLSSGVINLHSSHTEEKHGPDIYNFNGRISDRSETPTSLTAVNNGSEPFVTPGSTSLKGNKISPEASNNKRKWSFKSPTTSPNLAVSRSNSFKMLNTGPGSISNVPNMSTGSSNVNISIGENKHNNVTMPGNNLNVSATSFNTFNRLNNTDTSKLVSHSGSNQSFERKKSGDFNNNGNVSNVNMNIEVIKDVSHSSRNNSESIDNQTVSNTAGVTKSRWSFKPRTVPSPVVIEKSSSQQGNNENQSRVTDRTNQNSDDLWQDDLSDELLSQMSDEMMQ